MQVSEKKTCSVVNSPVGMCDSLPGFFNGNMGVGSSFCSVFGFFRGFVRQIGSENRIGEWFHIWEVDK